ncbi:MAG: response regulator, partial [Ignavibacteria bacterium]|nr:response regulator [Ignavibacteria bacterium]
MKKILIIEDDSNVRGNIAALLEEENFAVAIADNGKTGIEKAKEFLPDLI